MINNCGDGRAVDGYKTAALDFGIVGGTLVFEFPRGVFIGGAGIGIVLGAAPNGAVTGSTGT